MADKVIKGETDLRRAYQDETVAREYVDRRFITPLGRLLHTSQVRAVREVIDQASIKRAVEIAPGPARVSIDVVPLLDAVTLVDASRQMLGEARRRLASRRLDSKVRLVQSDAFNLPLQRNAFDLVYSFRLIRHFDRADRIRLYRQAFEIIRPGGWLVFDAVNSVVSAPLRAAAPSEYEHYDALLSPAEIREELRESGFELRSLQGTQHRYSLLTKCQVYVAPRSARLAAGLMSMIDRSGGEPLEWVVVCRRE